MEEGNGIYVIDWTYWDCVHVHRAVSRCIAGVWIIFMLGILYRVLEGNLTVRVHGYEVFECRFTWAPLLLALNLELTVSAIRMTRLQSNPSLNGIRNHTSLRCNLIRAWNSRSKEIFNLQSHILYILYTIHQRFCTHSPPSITRLPTSPLHLA